jgi:hypothetical protein
MSVVLIFGVPLAAVLLFDLIRSVRNDVRGNH